MKEECCDACKCSLYPLTIVEDRYTGVYSGGIYTAWHLAPYEVPKEIDDDDVVCRLFWYKVSDKEVSYPVGVGNTIKEAIEDLKKKLGDES